MDHDADDHGRVSAYKARLELDGPMVEHLSYRYVIVKEDDKAEYSQAWLYKDIDREPRRIRVNDPEVEKVKKDAATNMLAINDYWVVIGANDPRNHRKQLYCVAKPVLPKNPYLDLEADDDD